MKLLQSPKTTLLICITMLLVACFASRDPIQVRPTTLTVVSIELRKEKMIVNLINDRKNIAYYVEVSIEDSAMYRVGDVVGFLSPR